VVEVSKKQSSLKIERVICTVDCGVAVNPNIIAMQMESGTGFGLSAALAGAHHAKGWHRRAVQLP
jgi:isoquinoline 1-oxidoreductase subunit beta